MKLWLCIYCFAHICLVVPDLNSSNITLCFPETNTSLFKVLLSSFFFTRNSAVFYPPVVLKEIFSPCHILLVSFTTELGLTKKNKNL